MARFFVSMRLTDKGTNELNTLTGTFERVKGEVHEATGLEAEILAVFGGPFDFIADCTANEFDDAAYFALELARTGVVQTTTQKAYSLEGFMNVVQHSKMAP
jgi:uncharacterized protein with GYD domain